MYNCRRRKCCCLNNNIKKDDNCMYETLCNKPTCCNNKGYNLNCTCGFDDDIEDDVFPSNPIFGQSYVPFHTMDETFMPNCGLGKGTIFPELVSDYYPCQSMAEIQYLMDTNEIKEGCNK